MLLPTTVFKVEAVQEMGEMRPDNAVIIEQEHLGVGWIGWDSAVGRQLASLKYAHT